MATRRKLGNFADTYLKFHLQKQLAEQNAEAIASRQAALQAQAHQQELRRMALNDPSGRIASATGQDYLRQNPKGLLSELANRIGSAKTLNELTDSGSIRNEATSTLDRAGYDPAGAVDSPGGLQLPLKSKEIASIPGESGVNTLQARTLVPAERPEIEDLIAQREGRKESILNAEAFKADQQLALAKGEARERVIGTSQGEDQTLPAKMARDKQLGANALGIELERRRQIDPLDIRRAGGIAHAQEGARLDPRFIDARVDEDNRKARNRMQIAQEFGRLPDSAMRARGIMPIIIEASGNAKQLESQGQAMRWGQMGASQSPLFSGWWNSADEQKYAQAANEFTNFVTLTLTGVTARPDEKATYIATYFPNKGEDVRTIKEKQAARDRFVGFVESMARQGRQFSSLAEAQAAFESGGANQGQVIDYRDFLGDTQ